MTDEKLIDAMHKGELDLHCVEVTIYQTCDNGLSISGHGKLGINKVGTIYLEFICLKADSIPTLKPRGFNFCFPDDSLDSSQTVYLEATSLDGYKLYADGFSLSISALQRQPPFRLYILLHEIYFTYDRNPSNELDNYLYFEFLGKARVPTNKMNSESNTYGSESYLWNESKIELNDISLNIIQKSDRATVRASGSFVADELYHALYFYIGLCSGAMPQPYSIIKGIDKKTTIYLKSVRKGLQGKTMPPPVADITSGEGFPASHYAILAKMLKVKRSHPLRFNSALSQWQRVWYSLQSENDIATLSLGVAVEGLLNDIFIPALKCAAPDQKLEQAKESLVEQIMKLNAADDHKKTLASSVERWGNIHPSKALAILIEKGVILATERKAWGELRNSAAHPVFKEHDEASQFKERQRLFTTLTLFYRLILNIFEYKGGMYEFRVNEKPDYRDRGFIKILPDEQP